VGHERTVARDFYIVHDQVWVCLSLRLRVWGASKPWETTDNDLDASTSTQTRPVHVPPSRHLAQLIYIISIAKHPT
jgi:hypothetical protein